jgi:predicted neutral ceramidase superfamily lipid hydrolase
MPRQTTPSLRHALKSPVYFTTNSWSQIIFASTTKGYNQPVQATGKLIYAHAMTTQTRFATCMERAAWATAAGGHRFR